MGCDDICITADCDEAAPEFCTQKIRRAAKAYRCEECGDAIALGDRHESISGKWDGDFATFRTCLSCAEIRKAFYCGGWLIGSLWEDIREQVFPLWNEISAIDCLAKLEAPAAVAKMRAKYAEWHSLWRSDDPPASHD